MYLDAHNLHEWVMPKYLTRSHFGLLPVGKKKISMFGIYVNY